MFNYVLFRPEDNSLESVKMKLEALRMDNKPAEERCSEDRQNLQVGQERSNMPGGMALNLQDSASYQQQQVKKFLFCGWMGCRT